MKVSTSEKGISGTYNSGGNLYSESNNALLYNQAYGTPGSREWGEWEALVRTDPAVAAGLDFVCGPIRDARVDVKAADESLQAEAIAEFVRWNLLETLEPGFPEFLTQATKGMLGTGFAIFEPVFAKVKHASLPGGVGYGVSKVAQRLSNTMAWNGWVDNEDGTDLKAIRQQGQKGASQWATIEVPASDILLFTWQRNGNNYAGFSAFRAVWYAAKIRRELLRLVGVTYQREGAGVPVASATDRAAELTAQQRVDIEKLLANLVYHENASVVMPAGWSIDWVFAPGANKGHVLDAWNRLGIAILEQVQAQQLGLGTGETGSRAVGQVHDSSARAYIQSVTAVLEGVLNGVGSRSYTGLVRRLVDANWGPQATYPRVTLTMKQAQLSPKELLEAVASGVASKALTITAKDEDALREKLGLSPLDDGERETELERRRALAPPLPVAPPPFAAKHKASAPRVNKPWSPWRPLRASEKPLDLTGMDAFLASRPDVFEREIRPAVVEMLAKAAPGISAAMVDGNPDEVASLPFDTARLSALIQVFLEDVRAEGKRTVKRELREDSAEAVLQERREEHLSQTTRAAAEPEDIAEAEKDAAELLAQQNKALVRRMTNRLRSEIEREAIDVIRTGGDAGEVIANTITNQLESGAFRSDSLFVTTKAFNTGRDEAARILGGVTEVEYSAILDSSTCSPCMAMDGQTADFGTPEHDAMVPPNRDCDGGDRCRCVLVFITAPQEDDE